MRLTTGLALMAGIAIGLALMLIDRHANAVAYTIASIDRAAKADKR
jgi:hypothetical protein